MANHRVMKYQDEENEEQLRLNLDLIDEVRIDAEHRITRYKNLMARQYDAMVKPRRFNIRDLVQKGSPWQLETRPMESWGLIRKDLINCKRQRSYYLKALDGQKLEHPWNVEHLRRYYQ